MTFAGADASHPPNRKPQNLCRSSGVYRAGATGLEPAIYTPHPDPSVSARGS